MIDRSRRGRTTCSVSNGEIGEFVVSGPVVTREYFNRPEATALAKIKSAAGDAVLSPHGRRRLSGRQGQALVLWPQVASGDRSGRDLFHDPVRSDFQRPSGGGEDGARGSNRQAAR